MELEGILAFAVGMTLLAVSPGPGLAAVLSRTLCSGVRAGLLVVAGLVLVDFLFLGIALVGLSVISEFLGPIFQAIKYLAAAYLVFFGIKAIRASASQLQIRNATESAPWKDVLLGSAVTLGNPKAILFYSAFLPTFFSIDRLGVSEYFTICAVISVVSLVVYGAYILIADRSLQAATSSKLSARIQKVSGVTLVGSGVIIATRQ